MAYKVKTLQITGLGKKIFNSGDIIGDGYFPEARLKFLLDGGYIVPVEVAEVELPSEEETEDVSGTEEVTDINQAETEELPSEEVADKEAKEVEFPVDEEGKREQIMMELTARGIKFKKKMTTAELQKLLESE